VMLRQRTSELAEATSQLHVLQDYKRQMEALASPVEALASPVDGFDVHREEASAQENDGDDVDPSSSDLNVDDKRSWNDTNRSWCTNSTVVKSKDSLHTANKTLDDVSCQCYAQHNISCRSARTDSTYPLRCVAIGDLSPCERGRRFSGKATFDGKKHLFFKLGRYSTTTPDQTRSFTDGSVIEENRVFLAQAPPDDTDTTRKLRSSSRKED
jgi:hypothetical protein